MFHPPNISPHEVIEIAIFTFKRHLKRILLRRLKHERAEEHRRVEGTRESFTYSGNL